MFVVITLIVLLARDISELGKIPLRGMRTLRAQLLSFSKKKHQDKLGRVRNGNLPLGLMFVVITLIVLLARDISELGKIPLRGMRLANANPN